MSPTKPLDQAAGRLSRRSARGQGHSRRPPRYLRVFESVAKTIYAMGGEPYHLEAALQVSPDVIARWENEHPAFRKARQEGEEFADNTVMRSLAQRAIGYTIERIKLMRIDGKVMPVRYPFQVIPNVKACFLWLANRRPEEWADVLPRRRPRKGKLQPKPESESERNLKEYFRHLNGALEMMPPEGKVDDQPPQNPS